MKIIGAFVCVLATLSGLAGSSIWHDLDYIQKVYSSAEQLKCEVNLDYFADYQSSKKDYSLHTRILLSKDKYYSTLGTMEMIINGDRGLMIDHDKKYAFFSSAKKVKKATSSNPITMTDIKGMMDSSRRFIDTVYVLSERQGVRTYYISFKAGNYYKFMHFAYNIKTGLITRVDYFFKATELEKLARVSIYYTHSTEFNADDVAMVSLDHYLQKGKDPKLANRFKSYEFIIDKNNK